MTLLSTETVGRNFSQLQDNKGEGCNLGGELGWMEGGRSGRGASALHPASGENWLILKGKTFKYTKDIERKQCIIHYKFSHDDCMTGNYIS